MQRPLKFLAIHAHPDDIEFQCAGVLLMLRHLGHEIHLATMTPGDCGSAEHSAEEISRIRRAEAQAAADLLGAGYTCLEFRDLAIVHDNPSRQRVTELLRQVRPDVIFTAPPVDYMSDHEMTSKLVRDAAFNASIPNYRTNAKSPSPATERIPTLYYVDPIEGVDWYGARQEPQFYIDISAVFDRKQAMLACHESQRNWLLKQHGIDEYLETQRRWSAHRGSEVGVAFAEAFRQHLGHPYPHLNVLQECLPKFCLLKSS